VTLPPSFIQQELESGGAQLSKEQLEGCAGIGLGQSAQAMPTAVIKGISVSDALRAKIIFGFLSRSKYRGLSLAHHS
jgi:hypothetical protein